MDDDSSCSALNRLRAKLRELMKGGQRADQQVSMVVEKSIETMVELSKGCEDLKSENENLLAQLEALRKKLAPDVSELHDKIKKCETLIADLKRQLVEKDQIINNLERKIFDEKRVSGQLEEDLDKMSVSHKALMKELAAMKDELKKRDEKVLHCLKIFNLLI